MPTPIRRVAGFMSDCVRPHSDFTRLPQVCERQFLRVGTAVGAVGVRRVSRHEFIGHRLHRQRLAIFPARPLLVSARGIDTDRAADRASRKGDDIALIDNRARRILYSRLRGRIGVMDLGTRRACYRSRRLDIIGRAIGIVVIICDLTFRVGRRDRLVASRRIRGRIDARSCCCAHWSDGTVSAIQARRIRPTPAATLIVERWRSKPIQQARISIRSSQ